MSRVHHFRERRLSVRRALVCSLAAALLGIGGCGDGGGEPPGSAASASASSAAPAKPAEPAAPPAPAPKPAAAPVAAPAAAAAPPKPTGKVVEVKLTGNDAIQYSLNEFAVGAGDTVRLTLTNIGQMPKAAMGHNVTILKIGTDVEAFATKAVVAMETDYLPPDAPEVIAHTRLLGPGESDTIEFVAPAAGDYPFMCTFPAHFLTMKGVMKVR